MSFLSMGGYAAYVWPAFGATALVLALLLLASLRSLRGRERTWRALQQDVAEARRRSGRREEIRLRGPATLDATTADGGCPLGAAADAGRGHA